MFIEKLSASSYKKFSFCEQAYLIENILNYRFPGGKAMNLGTIVHAVLQILAEIKLAKQQNLSSVKTELGDLDTNNFDIDIITDQIYKKYTDEFIHLGWDNKDYKTIKKYVAKGISHNNGYFNPLNREVISVEQYIKIPITESWAILPDQKQFCLTGKIDLITKCNEECIEITDYKSGNAKSDFLSGKPIDETFLFDDIQMRIYHYACCELFGYDKNYLITLFFLQGGPITISFAPEDAMNTKERIKTRFMKILGTKVPKLSRSYKCTRFCDYGRKEFQNDKIKTPIQFLEGQVSPMGAPMCYCDMVKFETDRRGLKWVIENLKNES